MFEEILSRIGSVLRIQGIPYMIIGGQAVLLYGEPRLTRDIDITLGMNIDQLARLLTAVGALHLRAIPHDIEAFVQKTMVLPAVDDTSGIRVDFIFSFTPYESEAIKRARTIPILDTGVSFATPEDVIIHKVFAGRPRDLEDLKNILLKNKNLDYEYIRKWLREFDTSAEGAPFLAIFENLLTEIQK